MPKNPVTDPITDQEIAFARLILSGTMNDRRAAEAVGFNPSTAAYTKSKPRVRDYMLQHRSAVNQKLVDHEAEGQSTLSLGRDQILRRLWELANLTPEATRGSITGQVKAMSMIVAIEGLMPDRRSSPAHKQPKALPVRAQIYVSEPMRRRYQAEDTGAGGAVTAAETQPAAPEVPQPVPTPTLGGDTPAPNLDRQPTSLNNPFILPGSGELGSGSDGSRLRRQPHHHRPPQAVHVSSQRRLRTQPLKSAKKAKFYLILCNLPPYGVAHGSPLLA